MPIKSNKKKCSIKKRIAMKVTSAYFLGGLNCLTMKGGGNGIDD